MSTEATSRLLDLPQEVYMRLRQSFLLSFATFGLVLLIMGGTVLRYLGADTWAGLTGAAGVILFLVNITGYLIYQYLEEQY